MTVLRAQRETEALRVIVEHSDLSDVALRRAAEALDAIRAGLNAKRTEHGLAA